jgi:hypothetical protein
MKTTKQRLEHYRAMAAKYPGRVWRDWINRGLTFAAPSNARGPAGQIFSETLDQYGQPLGAAHALFPRMLDYNGWYADNFQDALIVGHVCRMRCPRGTLYIPATVCTGWEGTVHYINDAALAPKGATEEQHDQACREAARSADHYAEKEAEKSREAEAKDRAEQDIMEARKAIHEVNKAALALIREAKAQPGGYTPAVCAAVRASIAGYLRERAEHFAAIAARESDYWSACPNW